MSHTVTVTKLPDETSDDIEYEFGGTHDDRCQVLRECLKDWHRHPISDDIRYGDGEWSTKRAGYHYWADGSWTVPVDQEDYCALRFVFEGWTPEESLEGLRVGETRDVTTEWDGDGWTLVPAAPSTPAVTS